MNNTEDVQVEEQPRPVRRRIEEPPSLRCPKCRFAIKKEMKECPRCQTLLFFETSTLEDRLEKIKTYSLGQLLLREREYLFESIYREEALGFKIKYYLLFAVAFSAVFGALLGCYAGNLQIFAAAIKVPLLLFGTLLICLPALFTFNILLGSKLSFQQTLTMLLVSNYLTSIVLVSLSPIVFFFVVSAGSHDFVSLLNVMSFAIAGLAGIRLLWAGMKYLTRRSGSRSNFLLLSTWSVIYMFVGTQLAWRLRPFVGNPGDFAWYREIEGNFYLAVFHMLVGLFT